VAPTDRTIMLAHGCTPRDEDLGTFRSRWMRRMTRNLRARGWGDAIMQSFEDSEHMGLVAIGLPDAPGRPLLSFAWWFIEDSLGADAHVIQQLSKMIEESNAH
jgi:hypothetical protein